LCVITPVWQFLRSNSCAIDVDDVDEVDVDQVDIDDVKSCKCDVDVGVDDVGDVKEM
jgi:hypothetical protein